ncbi:glycosyl hydrolase [Chitinophaga sp. MM2321]|uniref:glycosyl hydrolase n=1 Tax=Chitinophaga sp. MM2321 TaxID=3137178 RepID=UPI0032D5AD48
MIIKRRFYFTLLLCFTSVYPAIAQDIAVFSNWTTTELVKGGRIDAIRALEGPVVLCATRGQNRGMLFISENYGRSWKFLAKPTTSEITCIGETGNRREFYILTGNAEVLGTKDGGRSWKKLTTLTTNKNRDGAQAAYAIFYTVKGTLLVTDTDSDGGHIYRSVDKGNTWTDLGKIGDNALYRLEKTADGVIVNGFDGNVYKSTDDGLNWRKTGSLSTSALFATTSLSGAALLQADQAGNIYNSRDHGNSWHKTGMLNGAADDFIHAGEGVVYYSTYTDKRSVYVSLNYGKDWQDIGPVPTKAEGDWLDHGISMDTKDSVVILAGTGKGFMIRNVIDKKTMYARAAKDSIIPRRNPRVLYTGAKNLLPNASFEAGPAGWSSMGKYTGWGGDLVGLYGDVVSDEAHDGKHSLRIELGPGKTPVTFYDVWPIARNVQNAPLAANIGWVNAIPGNEYTLSAWMRADRAGVPAKLLFSRGLEPSLGYHPTQVSKEVVLTEKWARYSFTVTAIEQDLYVAVGPNLLRDDDEAVVWIDAIQLEQGAKATSFVINEAVELGVSSKAFGNIFHTPSAAKVWLVAANRTKRPVTVPVTAEISDYFGKQVSAVTKNIRISGGSSQEMEWPLALTDNGYYQVKFSWRFNNLDQERILRMAVIDPYNSPHAAFGINHAPTTKEAGKALHQAGVTWARNWSINWGLLEPVKGQLSFAPADEQVDREQAEGYNVLALMPPLPAPAWGSTAPDSVKNVGWQRMSYMPKERAGLMDFISKAIGHYKSRIRYFEFLNEPVWTQFCLPNEAYKLPGAAYVPEDYIGLLEEAYLVMKKADPTCQVIGGFSAEPWRYMKTFFDAGGMKSIDILNIHNYGMLRTPESFIHEMDTLLAQMERQGPRKPIWITEYSYYAADNLPWSPWVAPPHHSSANLLLSNEKQCADWSIRYNAIMLARGVEKIFYHQGGEGFVNDASPHLEFALLGEGGEPRKLYPAQAVMAKMIGPDFKYAAAIEKDSVQGYSFQCGNKAVLIAWVTEKETRQLSLDIPEGVKAYNIMGAPIRTGNKIALDISPVYLVSDSLSATALAQSCNIKSN